MSAVRVAALLAVCVAAQAMADDAKPHEVFRPYDTSLELDFGGYKPLIDSEAGLTSSPYNSTFGSGAMLLFQAEVDRFLWQKVGSVGVGFSFGYAEKYGPAVTASGSTTSEKTSLHVLPLKLQAVYRFDYAALHWGVPLEPFGKLGLVYEPWWVNKGDGVEYFNGQRGAGGKWGYSATLGVSLMLDFLEPDLARNLATDTGIQHTSLVAQWVHDKVPSFGGSGLDLSANHWLFGLGMDF